ncbi:E3 ubiquitin-protein ligase RNF128 isoform X2 [Protopterus annectens]|uniref:E3 ubiquitin-protein ligase RNF128 isoform X2 n=1 Tax=Protopterus annectens TaxID=7888 RepID=UPI001CFA2230|nr:E3 ubiquitin-protein ligase RNF128 isoform X2 [Protopterus annectens]
MASCKALPIDFWIIVMVALLQVSPPSAGQVSSAVVNVSYTDPKDNKTYSTKCDCGTYGMNSALEDAQGMLRIPTGASNRWACTAQTNFSFSDPETPWIALIERGNCTFSEKIRVAVDKGAAAVVVFNAPRPGNDTIPMALYDTGNAVAIMIGNTKGLALVDLIQRGTPVSMIIEVGRLHGPTANYYSIFFVSIAFFIVTAATVGYFIFYSARRLRVMRALNRRQKQLKQDAKKAINQLQLRTLKQGDPALGPEGDSCAVCIEVYRPSDVVRILTCNHFFHKACIDPWLLEHRTCPMCKCDILKALGIEADVEEGPETPPEQETVIPSAPEGTAYTEPQDNRSETASSGYASVQGVEEATVDEDHSSPSQGDRMNLVNHDSVHVAVNVPHHDNPTFEAEESHIQEVKS